MTDPTNPVSIPLASSTEAMGGLPEPMTVLPERAALLHEVNHQLLSGLDNCTEHFQALLEVGFSPEEIHRREYKTASPADIRKGVNALVEQYGLDQLESVPGFKRKGNQITFPERGLIVPIREQSGHILALQVYDLSLDGNLYAPENSNIGSPVGGRVHAPLGTPIPTPVLRIVDDPLYADLFTAECGVPTLGLTGWEALLQVVPVLLNQKVEELRLVLINSPSPDSVRQLKYNLYNLAGLPITIVVERCQRTTLPGEGTRFQKSLVHGPDVARLLDRLGKETLGGTTSESEPAVEPFPTDVFPPDLKRFCEEVAQATSTPTDFAGVTMLVTAGAAIGNSRALCVKEGTWYEPSSIYAMVVGSPASGKSPAQEPVLAPYQARDLAALETFRIEKESYEQAMADAARGTPRRRGSAGGAINGSVALPEPPEEPERLVVIDSTVEALVPLLAKNPRGLLLVLDEGAAWERSLNQYKGGKGRDRTFFLSAWSGKPYIVDRKSDPCPVAIGRPFLSVICGIQPDLLSELADRQSRADGFVDRILFAFPASSGAAPWTNAVVSAEAQEAWARILNSLRGMTLNNDEVANEQQQRG